MTPKKKMTFEELAEWTARTDESIRRLEDRIDVIAAEVGRVRRPRRRSEVTTEGRRRQLEEREERQRELKALIDRAKAELEENRKSA